jgi:hypothetical protein
MSQADNLAALATNVNSSGVLQVVGGGTGATTTTGAANSILPSQTSNSGKYLTTNGTDTSWGTVTSNPGTVTSVSGTAPVSVATGTSTPVISMAAATASVNGYMTSTFASKLDGIAAGAQPGTVTSVSGTGTVSGISLSGTVTSSGSLTLGGTLSVTSGNLPAGSVLQVVQTTNTSRSATACVNGGTDMPGMSVNITPSSASNKILVLINIAFNAPENENLVGMLLRNGTKINQNTSGPGVAGFFGIATANDGNYRMWSASGAFLDSPATTSAITYKLQGGGCNGTRTLYLNGTGRNSSTDATGSSTITVMEIKG